MQVKAKARMREREILADAKLYEARRIREAAETLSDNALAATLAQLDSVGSCLKQSATSTVFVGGGGGGGGGDGGGGDGGGIPIVNALLGNHAFVRPAERVPTATAPSSD